MEKWKTVDEKYFYLDKRLKIILIVVLLIFVFPYFCWVGPYIVGFVPESLGWICYSLGAAVLSIPLIILTGVIGRILVNVGLLVPDEEKTGANQVK